MMAALSEWLGRIVAVVLLVSLVDLLLPNKTMQRYVRLVAGLLVLLTVATPVLSWFRSDFSEKLTADINEVRLGYGKDKDALTQIEENGRKLSEARNEQALQLATAQLSSEIRTAVQNAGLGTVRTVDVQAEPADAGGIRVTRVELTIAAGSAADPSGTAGSEEDAAPIADVEPVAPVDIRIDAEEEEGSEESIGAPDGIPAGGQEADAELSSRVAALLATQFGVAPDLVSVRREASLPAY